ncbi:mitochondrial 54S ribosomal protein rml2 [Coemansia sp. RSA 552]|nr:mitochondrial 54S ribosomal protein rml2 [Coemansia sp. RSA 552]
MFALRQAIQRTQALASRRLMPAAVPRLTIRGMANTVDDGQFKTWKPLAPTLRHRRMTSRKHLHKGGPVKALTVAKRKKGGRNCTGRITCRHRGGGAKRRIRLVDFKRREPGPQEVVRLEYDPGRTSHIALLKHMETGKLSYILAPAGLKPGAVVQSFMSSPPVSVKTSAAKDEMKAEEPAVAEEPANAEGASAEAGTSEEVDTGPEELDAAPEEVPGARDYTSEGVLDKGHNENRPTLEIGNCMPLRMLPIGSVVHNVGLHPFGRAQMVRAAGASAQVLYTAPTGLAQLRLTSGEIRRVPVDACATLGRVSNMNHKHERLGSAGARRRRGWRPTVRGTAMNTHDHPHGGGRGKSKGNKDPRSPWGKLAKGGKTRRKLNPLVIRGRPRRR